MTREEVTKHIRESPKDNFLLILSTGFGKTYCALGLIEQRVKVGLPILIIIPRLVLIENWKKEIKKFGLEEYLPYITFTTYQSLHKYINTQWENVVYDECFLGTTEILTLKGYKKFKDLTEDDLVAQWENNGDISFVKPLRLIKNYYKGNICKIRLKQGRYVYMTPNHNQVYKTRKKDWSIKPIKDIKCNYNVLIPTSGKGTGNNNVLSPLEQLFIATQADGTLQRHQKNESVYSIQLIKQRKKDRILEILNKVGNYTKIKGRKGSDRYLYKLPKGDAKLLSTHFSIDMGYERANSFINEIINWDGSIINGNNFYYSSKVKENSDFVAGVAIQAGYEVFQSVEKDNRKNNYSDIHRVFLKKQSERSTQNMNKEYIPCDDFVYCVEVPSHKIVIRSEGVSFISGNCHHLSDRCKDLTNKIISKFNCFLSATVKQDLKQWIVDKYNPEVIEVNLRKAIDNDVLPEPKVYLMPLQLNNTFFTETLIREFKNKKKWAACFYSDRWKYLKDYNVKIKCTEQQYYNEISNDIEYWKKMYMGNTFFKNKWLHLCGTRLKWLSDKKTEIILHLLKHLKNYRTLTFCNSIEQTELLGKYCINSKNKLSGEYLNMFNNKKIKHITSVNMLNEGCNLTDCRIGIFASINSSEILIKQKNGRLLRHKNPVIIIPYYINTREEELVKQMLENYNPELVSTITNFEDIVL